MNFGLEFWDDNRVIVEEISWEVWLYELVCGGVCGWLWFFAWDFDMGGCFPCFGSSKKEGSGVKQVTKDSVKEGSAAQSHHVTRVSSGFDF